MAAVPRAFYAQCARPCAPETAPDGAATVRTAFAQETAKEAHGEWQQVADRLRVRFPKLGTLMDEAEHDVLAYHTFPSDHNRVRAGAILGQ